ncbi:MAG: RodZ domain-containing protein [Terriglobia bacterium]
MSQSEETIPMAGFGEYLRREREMRGVSLEEISTATKISIRFLKAIENEELSKLPGGIFTRSFVRTYARYLGLDEERVLADCQLAGQQKPEVDIRRITANRARSNGAASRTRLIAFLMAGVLLASGYALFRHSRRVMEQQSSTPMVTPQSTTAPGTNPPPTAAPVQPSTPAQPENNPSLSATSASPTAGATTAPGTLQGGPPSPGAKANPPNQSVTSEATSAVAAHTDLVLQVAATERVWVAVDADGKTVLQKVLNANEVENLKALDSFDVTIGNAQGVVLTLNGETLKPMGRRGEVKSIHLTRDDLKNAAPER